MFVPGELYSRVPRQSTGSGPLERFDRAFFVRKLEVFKADMWEQCGAALMSGVTLFALGSVSPACGMFAVTSWSWVSLSFCGVNNCRGLQVFPDTLALQVLEEGSGRLIRRWFQKAGLKRKVGS